MRDQSFNTPNYTKWTGKFCKRLYSAVRGFRKWFGLFYTVKVRNISVSEEIKTIGEQDTEDNMTTLFGLIPFTKRYDPHCYAPRYQYVPDGTPVPHTGLTKLDILRLPKKEVQTLDSRIKQAQEQAE
ncbi:MAG: hypothetical protein IJW55_08185 [Clostridia bacterium]|nr:hypothetical protein [Clostridia bacterium]